MRAVWISHPHADHHLGLATLLRRRAEALDRAGGGGAGGAPRQLVLMAPHPVLSWLQEYSRLEGARAALADLYRPVESSWIQRPDAPHPEGRYLLDELGLRGCFNVRVEHTRRG